MSDKILWQTTAFMPQRELEKTISYFYDKGWYKNPIVINFAKTWLHVHNSINEHEYFTLMLETDHILCDILTAIIDRYYSFAQTKNLTPVTISKDYDGETCVFFDEYAYQDMQNFQHLHQLVLKDSGEVVGVELSFDGQTVIYTNIFRFMTHSYKDRADLLYYTDNHKRFLKNDLDKFSRGLMTLADFKKVEEKVLKQYKGLIE